MKERFTSGLCEFIVCHDELVDENLSANETMKLMNKLYNDNYVLKEENKLLREKLDKIHNILIKQEAINDNIRGIIK